MNTRQMVDEIAAMNPEALTADGFEAALIGYVERFGQEPLPLYDREKCILILMEQSMTRADAEEFFSFNVIGAWMGDGTPAFATIRRTVR